MQTKNIPFTWKELEAVEIVQSLFDPSSERHAELIEKLNEVLSEVWVSTVKLWDPKSLSHFIDITTTLWIDITQFTGDIRERYYLTLERKNTPEALQRKEKVETILQLLEAGRLDSIIESSRKKIEILVVASNRKTIRNTVLTVALATALYLICS